ncbi:transcription repressor OFP7-like [Rhodamnia argentea]|uniref:Transcription repressor n=1 Tax=Rhodamnia argentea TaxID=178133 RepID=A0A8B8NN73_9MYRT|nr:transcription repressor OFP7-like [Rhodamnia argentea]
MAKRLKLRIARAFQSCRSKDASALPSDPVPSFLRLPPVGPALIAVDVSSSPRKPHRSFLNRHLPHALMPYGCGCGCRSRPSSHSRLSDDDRTGSQPRFHWKQEGGFHVMATARDEHAPRRKIYTSSASGGSDVDNDDDGADVVSALSPVVAKKKRCAKNKKKKTGIRLRGRLSTSSKDSGLFSSEDRGGGGASADYDDDEETETLVSSSRSFSTTESSSDHAFNPQLETIREAPKRRRRRRRRKKTVEVEAEAARLSVFRRMMPCGVMEGKVRESFAVVKRTEDPRGDFKRSMVEMIVEKQMFGEEDLQQLLRCLLSLNSRDHHGVIVDAFSEIWEALFGRRSSVGGR